MSANDQQRMNDHRLEQLEKGQTEIFQRLKETNDSQGRTEVVLARMESKIDEIGDLKKDVSKIKQDKSFVIGAVSAISFVGGIIGSVIGKFIK